MKLGVSWFDYEPQWKGNRDLPEGERLKLQIRRLRPVDLYADEDEAFYNEWRDGDLKSKYGETEFWPQISRFPSGVLAVLHRLTTHTRKWQGFEFEDGAKIDPIDIMLEVPTPIGLDQRDGLLWEITTALSETANLTGDELKNYSGPSVGGLLAQESTVETAPVEG